MNRGGILTISPVRSIRARIMSGLGNWPYWLGVLLLYATLEVAVLSLEQADWINPQPPLSLVLFLAIACGWFLSATRLRGVVILSLFLILGAGVTYWLGVIPGLAGGRELFSIFLVAVVWVMGTLSIWYLLRHDNGWVGAVSGGIVIVVNLSNLPPQFFYFLGLYFLAAVLLIIHVRLSRCDFDKQHGFQRRGRVFLFVILAVFTTAGTFFAWVMPQARAPFLQNTIATKLFWMRDAEESSFNIFASVPSKQPLSTIATRGDLALGTNWHHSDQIDYIIQAPYATYWRVHAYDTYTGEGWQNLPTADTVFTENTEWNGSASVDGSRTLTYSVTPEIRTDSLLTGGIFLSAGVPYVIHENQGQVMTVTAPRVLGVEETYSMTTSVFLPSVRELADVQSGYPQAIGDVYLALPADFPESVRSLAVKIAGDAGTPFEKVDDIDQYLSDFSYKLEIPGPEPGQDGVEYFLFEEKSGFCTYFASAMAVMLRAVDVPTRLAIGYLPGDPGDNPGEYILRDKSYHAWVQVWFDGYGWVDIEATPSGTGDPSDEIRNENPVVSAIDLGQPPSWDDWYDQLLTPPPAPNTGGAVTQPDEPTAPQLRFAFSEALARALIITGIVLLVILIVFLPVMIARAAFNRWLWQVDRSDLAARTYLKMGKLAAVVQLGPSPSQTPAEYANMLEKVMPEQTGNIETISRAFIETRFARAGKPNLFEEAEILKARCGVYDALLGRFGFLRRFLDRWF